LRLGSFVTDQVAREGRHEDGGDEMDGAVVETSAFMTWFQEWGPVFFYIAQVIFCLVLSVASVWAAATFKKLVDLKKIELGIEDKPAVKAEVAVEEFVD
jgi:hypothetical protein